MRALLVAVAAGHVRALRRPASGVARRPPPRAAALTSSAAPPAPPRSTADRVLAWREVDRKGGGEARPPVVILHGLLGSKRNFGTFAARLARNLANARRVIAVDLRCHGDSFGDDRMDYAAMASDVFATLDAAGVRTCALLGHSMGGKVAMACALDATRARRVSELCVLDMAPTAYSTADGSQWKAARALVGALAALDLAALPDAAAADAALARSVLDPDLRAFALTNLVRAPAGGLAWRCALGAIAANLDRLATWDAAGTAPPFGGDALFLKGAQSRYVRSVHLPEIARAFPSFTLQTVPDAGHWVHAENPDATLDFVEAFLDR